MNISVIIPTYNRYTLLKRALTSVYAQTLQPQEVIVVDDGSTDNTSYIIQDFPKITYMYQENSGVSSARNLGIKNSTCKWIAFLDSDDAWDKNKLALHVEFHKNNPHILMSYTNEKWIRDHKEIRVPKKYQKFEGNIFDKCLSHCIIAPSSVYLHRAILESIGLFDESLEVCEDYDLWLRLTCKYEVGVLQERLITKYAGHENQLSFKYWGMDRFRVQSLEKFLDTDKKELVKEMLVKKYTLLLKGALKYDRIAEIKIYKEKIKKYE